MGASITYQGGTLPTPELVLADTFKWSRQSQSALHKLASGKTVATLHPASLRSGSLELLYASQTSAELAASLLSLASTFTYTDTAPVMSLKFAVDGTIDVELDSDTQKRWKVTVNYRELT